MSALATRLDQYRFVTLSSSRALYPDAEGDDLPLLKVESPLCRAVVSLQGAQLLEFENRKGTPLLWLSPQCQFHEGSALRGGIPLCLPWFGPHPNDPNKPKHGFARTSEWELTQVAENDEGRCELLFQWQHDADERFEHAFTAELRMMLGRQIELELSMTSRASESFDCSWALHSYFPVSALDQARVTGLEGHDYFDNLDDLKSHRQKAAVRFEDEVDRVFPAIQESVKLEGRPAICISHHGSPTVITWNPGAKKAADMADVGEGNQKGFVCVERGAVFDDQWQLQPGEKRSGQMVIEQV